MELQGLDFEHQRKPLSVMSDNIHRFSNERLIYSNMYEISANNTNNRINQFSKIIN